MKADEGDLLHEFKLPYVNTLFLWEVWLLFSVLQQFTQARLLHLNCFSGAMEMGKERGVLDAHIGTRWEMTL